MDTFTICLSSGIIAVSPLILGHVIFHSNVRYILLSWLCSFVSTICLIFCSLVGLIIQNHILLLIISVIIDNIGKIILTLIGSKMKFLQTPVSHLCLGLCMGVGFGLAHTLTLFIPVAMDQPYSLDFDDRHPSWFPNCLDFGFVYHALNMFHIAVSLFYFRMTASKPYIIYTITILLHMIFSFLTLIPIPFVKLLIMLPSSYFLVYKSLISYRTFEYQRVEESQPEDADDIVTLQEND